MGFDAGDSNLYRYVNNKPTEATDPSGFQVVRGSVDIGDLIHYIWTAPNGQTFDILLSSQVVNGRLVVQDGHIQGTGNVNTAMRPGYRGLRQLGLDLENFFGASEVEIPALGRTTGARGSFGPGVFRGGVRVTLSSVSALSTVMSAAVDVKQADINTRLQLQQWGTVINGNMMTGFEQNAATQYMNSLHGNYTPPDPNGPYVGLLGPLANYLFRSRPLPGGFEGGFSQ